MKSLDLMLSEDPFQLYHVAALFLSCSVCKAFPVQFCGFQHIHNIPSSLEDQLYYVFQGILSDDHGLAAALWRTFFNQKCEDPRQLELLVEYVRKQVSSSTPRLQRLMESKSFLRTVDAGLAEDWERLSFHRPI